METRQIKTSYSASAGTAYITFDNVKVPVENTLGEEGGGIFVILRFEHVQSLFVEHIMTHLCSNFNHERWVMCCASARSQRVVGPYFDSS